MNSIAFIDTEIDPKSGKILDIDSVKGDGSIFHKSSVAPNSKQHRRIERKFSMSGFPTYCQSIAKAFAESEFEKYPNSPGTGAKCFRRENRIFPGLLRHPACVVYFSP
jgi:hypothetical protein